jgi:hypothetical protein
MPNFQSRKLLPFNSLIRLRAEAEKEEAEEDDVMMTAVGLGRWGKLMNERLS